MNKKKSTGLIIAIVCICLAAVLVVFLLPKLGHEGKDEYFEGKILEKTDDKIVVQIDPTYKDLIGSVGQTVEVKKADLVSEVDFSKFSAGEGVRVLYGGIDSKNKQIDKLYKVYTLAELQTLESQTAPST